MLTEERRFGVPTGDLTHRSFPDGCPFSRVFGPESTSEQVFEESVAPLLDSVRRDDTRATVMAFGLTGTGKTHTMTALQGLAAAALLEPIRCAEPPETAAADDAPSASASAPACLGVNFFEVSGFKVLDLLNERAALTLQQVSSSCVHVISVF